MPIGRPLSPMSVAGMKRREDRRDGPGDNNKHGAAKTVAAAAIVGPGAAVVAHRRNK
jgi:hypothetical protein